MKKSTAIKADRPRMVSAHKVNDTSTAPPASYGIRSASSLPEADASHYASTPLRTKKRTGKTK